MYEGLLPERSFWPRVQDFSVRQVVPVKDSKLSVSFQFKACLPVDSFFILPPVCRHLVLDIVTLPDHKLRDTLCTLNDRTPQYDFITRVRKPPFVVFQQVTKRNSFFMSDTSVQQLCLFPVCLTVAVRLLSLDWTEGKLCSLVSLRGAAQSQTCFSLLPLLSLSSQEYLLCNKSFRSNFVSENA